MSTKTIARMGLFIALSVVGAFIKIPSPTGTVALDSAPGFFAAAAFGGGEAALIIALGHLVSSGIVGFPLTLPIHLLIAGQMAAFAYLFGFLVRKTTGYVAVPVTTLANGVLAPLSMVPIFGWPFFVGMVIPLLVGSLVNILLAFLVYRTMAKAGGKIAA
ncbi:MAG: ECF transporter S component [Bacillota bacterium]